MKIKVSKNEIAVLEEACHNVGKDYILSNLLNKEEMLINGNSDEIDELRNVCGEYIAYVGFNGNDELTQRGLILEDLIDKLFVENVSADSRGDATKDRSYATSDILDDKFGVPCQLYIGKEATVVVNPVNKKSLTAWKTSSRLLQKLLKK